MGYGTRPGNLGHTIRTFWPDDTDTEIYLYASQTWSLPEIHARIKEKWPDVSIENITITAEWIHTDCIGYDLYDPTDYTNFIIIRKI